MQLEQARELFGDVLAELRERGVSYAQPDNPHIVSAIIRGELRSQFRLDLLPAPSGMLYLSGPQMGMGQEFGVIYNADSNCREQACIGRNNLSATVLAPFEQLGGIIVEDVQRAQESPQTFFRERFRGAEIAISASGIIRA